MGGIVKWCNCHGKLWRLQEDSKATPRDCTPPLPAPSPGHTQTCEATEDEFLDWLSPAMIHPSCPDSTVTQDLNPYCPGNKYKGERMPTGPEAVLSASSWPSRSQCRQPLSQRLGQGISNSDRGHCQLGTEAPARRSFCRFCPEYHFVWLFMCTLYKKMAT